MSFSKVLHTKHLKGATKLMLLSVLTIRQFSVQHFANDLTFQFHQVDAQSFPVLDIVT